MKSPWIVRTLSAVGLLMACTMARTMALAQQSKPAVKAVKWAADTLEKGTKITRTVRFHRVIKDLNQPQAKPQSVTVEKSKVIVIEKCAPTRVDKARVQYKLWRNTVSGQSTPTLDALHGHSVELKRGRAGPKCMRFDGGPPLSKVAAHAEQEEALFFDRRYNEWVYCMRRRQAKPGESIVLSETLIRQLINMSNPGFKFTKRHAVYRKTELKKGRHFLIFDLVVEGQERAGSTTIALKSKGQLRIDQKSGRQQSLSLVGSIRLDSPQNKAKVSFEVASNFEWSSVNGKKAKGSGSKAKPRAKSN